LLVSLNFSNPSSTNNPCLHGLRSIDQFNNWPIVKRHRLLIFSAPINTVWIHSKKDEGSNPLGVIDLGSFLKFTGKSLYVRVAFTTDPTTVKPVLDPMVAAIESRTLLRQRYLIQHLLGQGGFGRTYLALDRERFDEPCVLKEFTVSYQDESLVAKAKSLFAREASILHQVQHPQIPRFWAAFEWEDRLFLVQDYIQGENYRTLLQARRDRDATLSEVEVLHLLNHLLPVLSYLHDRQIVHRDISPENLVLSPAKGSPEHRSNPDDYTAGLPVLLDFGSVKAATSGLALVSSMTRVGKVGYAPPEQLQTGNVQPHSDLYALAATCIVLLTGREPHQLLDSLTLDWHWQSYTSVSRELANMLNRMLALHPTDRYATASAVHTDLQRLLGVLTPMIWRPEYVSWQGFASPIHQGSTTPPLTATARPTGPTIGAMPLSLPPTHLQTIGQKLSRWKLGHGSATSRLPQDLPDRAMGDDRATRNVATLPPLMASPDRTATPTMRGHRPDWSPRLAIVAAGLMVSGLGLHLFHSPIPANYQVWLAPPSATPAPVRQTVPETTGPRTIEFGPNEVSAVLQGGLRENQTQIYQFRADKGQVTAIGLEGSGVKMNLLRADQRPIDKAAWQTRKWTGQLPASESYQVQITGSGDYVLDLSISPNPKRPIADRQPLDFAQHSTKTITGELLSGQTQHYVLAAPAGQRFGFKVLQGDLQVRVVAPTGKPLGQSKTGWQGKAPIAGNYTIAITAKQREDYAISFDRK
jgi:serine/threonine protein kinase